MDNYIEVLDALLADWQKQKQKKKKGPGKQAQNDYLQAMESLITAEGFSPDAEKYLYDGFAFGGARAFWDFMKSQEDQAAALDLLYKGSRYQEDRFTAARMIVNLLAVALNEDGDCRIIVSLLRHMPAIMQNKEHKLDGNAPIILRKYLFDILREDVDFPPLPLLETGGLSRASITALRELFSQVIPRIPDANRKRAATRANIEKAIAWLQIESEVAIEAPAQSDQDKDTVDGGQQPSVGLNPADSQSAKEPVLSLVPIEKLQMETAWTAAPGEPDKAADIAGGDLPAEDSERQVDSAQAVNGETAETHCDSTDVDTQEQNEAENQAAGDSADAAGPAEAGNDAFNAVLLFARLKTAEDALKTAETRLSELELQNTEYAKRLASERAKVKRLEAKIEEQNGSIQKNLGIIAERESAIMEYKKTLDEKDNSLRENAEKISKLEAGVDILRKDRSSQAEAVVNKLASRLRSVYAEFLDIEEMTMTTETEEYLRDQLRDVFQKLISAGVSLK